MAEEKLTLEQIIDRISERNSRLNWSDLQAVALLQAQFNQASNQANDQGRETICSICASLAKLLEKVILEEVKAEGEAKNVVERGVETLKALMKQPQQDESDTAATVSGLMDQILQLAGEIVEPVEFEAVSEVGVEPGADLLGSILGLEDMEEILKDFLAATPVMLDELEAMILTFESGSGDPDLINRIFRTFHTLKGESSLFGITKFSQICHAAETLMECVREGKRVSVRETVDALLASLDILKDIIGRYKAGNREIEDIDADAVIEKISQASPLPEEAAKATARIENARESVGEQEEQSEQTGDDEILTETSLLAGFITEAGEHIEAIEEGLLLLEENPADKEIINRVFRPFHTIKGLAGFLNLRSIGALTHELETLLDRARKGELAITAQIVDLLFDAVDVIKSLISLISAKIQERDGGAQEVDIAPQLRRIRALGGADAAASGSELKEEVETAEAAAELASVRLDNVVEVDSRNQAHSRTAASEPASFIKVAMSKLDNLLDMAGELVIAQSQLSQHQVIANSGNDRLQKNISRLEKITRDVQELVMCTRMVPVKGTFHKMARLVRDVARRSGKQVDFKMSGEDTELDKNVTELIADPLIHMIRNAVDHGIEPPDVRIRAGKDARGTVALSAFHQGGNVIIRIVDDGRGLDKDSILQKAIAQGIVEEGEVLTDQEINGLIFRPGFSTAERVTDVSGRGVGMDVVKRNIENLRGKVDIRSERGRGSTFTISLPLTLAIIEGMVVAVGRERYIIPLLSILESLRPLEKDIKTLAGRVEMVNIRGELLPLVRLHELLEVTPDRVNPWETMIVVVEDQDRRCCLMIDDLIGQQQVVIKSLGDSFRHVEGVSGGAVLGDGRVGLILDIGGIMNHLQMRSNRKFDEQGLLKIVANST